MYSSVISKDRHYWNNLLYKNTMNWQSREIHIRVFTKLITKTFISFVISPIQHRWKWRRDKGSLVILTNLACLPLESAIKINQRIYLYISVSWQKEGYRFFIPMSSRSFFLLPFYFFSSFLPASRVTITIFVSESR